LLVVVVMVVVVLVVVVVEIVGIYGGIRRRNRSGYMMEKSHQNSERYSTFVRECIFLGKVKCLESAKRHGKYFFINFYCVFSILQKSSLFSCIEIIWNKFQR